MSSPTSKIKVFTGGTVSVLNQATNTLTANEIIYQ